MSLPPISEYRFGRDVAVTAVSRITFAAAGAALTVLVARHLGPAGQGGFAVAFSLTLLLVQIGSLGLPIAFTAFVAREPPLTNALATAAAASGLGVGVVLGGATFAVAQAVPALFPGLGAGELLLAVGAMPLALSVVFLQGVLLGGGRVLRYNAVDVVQAVAALAAVAVAIVSFDAGLRAILAILVASRAAALAIAAAGLRHELAHWAWPAREVLAAMIRSAARVYVVTTVAFALIRIDLILVNALASPADAGVYSLAATAAEAVSLLPAVVSAVLIRPIATSTGAEVAARVFRAMFLLHGALCAISVVVVAVAVPPVFGAAYERTIGLYFVLAPGVFVLGLLSVLMTHFAVRGFPGEVVRAFAVGLALNVAVNAALLPVFGVAVAPAASTGCYLLVLLLTLRAFARELPLSELVPRGADARALVRLARSVLG